MVFTMRGARVRARFRAGFTLIETSIAAMILGLVLVSVLAITSQCYRYLADIRLTARSSQVLQQKMEDIRLLSWSQVQALPAGFTDPHDTAGIFAGTIALAAFDSYDGATTVSKVTLTVTWTNQSGQVRANKLTSYVSNGGLNKYIF